MRPLVAIDWGTSSLRGARFDEAGRLLEEKSAPLGILRVPNGDFAGVFADQFADWMKPAGTLCLISGMAGSRQGWAEAPYVSCPAGPADLAQRLHWIERNRIALVPGLSDAQGAVPDVMRGEEVQIFGAMKLRGGTTDGLFVLPGTHSKWATVRGGKVMGFRTYMTGEAYALFSQHSILARTMDLSAPPDGQAFQDGVERARNGKGLLHALFGVRSLGLFGRLSPAASASYLSGLLIGDEIARETLPARVNLIADPRLSANYSTALGKFGVRVDCFGSQTAWMGLSEIARGMK